MNPPPKAARRNAATPSKDAISMGTVFSFMRQRRGLTQQQLAERMNVHPNTVYLCEHGRTMTLDSFFLFCKAIEREPGAVISELLAWVERDPEK